ncbi:MAG TPA: glycosyltransferase family 9 protein [Pyrinomonadaceae bacterium]|nr:glycosyltransferase family 9 protein [Pyrinomonadaceae bacterium]
MHILIVKLGSIGDIIHTLPALSAIRQALPDVEISWVVEERSAEMLRGNSLIDNLIEVDTKSLRGAKVIEEILLGATKQIKELRRFKFDVSIDFQGLLKSAMIGKLSGARQRFGFSKDGLREPASRLLLTDQVAVPTGIHIIRKNLALAAGALNIEVPDTYFEFPIATFSEHVAEAEAIIEAVCTSPRVSESETLHSNDSPLLTRGLVQRECFAVLNPAGGWVTKLWHAEKFGVLADRIWEEHGMASVVVTGPKESELAEKAAANSHSGKLTLAEPSLKGFYELAKRATVYVGGDTGPTHIAVAAGTPIVGIFGPTEWWRNGSPRADDICVERDDIDCRVDCHRRTCSKWICMDIEVETVLTAVGERLKRL